MVADDGSSNGCCTRSRPDDRVVRYEYSERLSKQIGKVPFTSKILTNPDTGMQQVATVASDGSLPLSLANAKGHQKAPVLTVRQR
jgi:hypothetical protein